jgi:adenylate cyclase
MMLAPRYSLTRPWLLRVLTGLWAMALGLWLVTSPPELLQRSDESARDHFVRAVARTDDESRVVVVDISEESLRQVGPWPWPRSRLADLVEILLTQYEARAIGLDIVMPEPEAAGAEGFGDARLAALAANGPVALSQLFDFSDRQLNLQLGKLSGGVLASERNFDATAKGFLANHAGLADARCVGNIGYVPDVDGVLRRLPHGVLFQGKVYPQLAEVLLACAPLNAVDVSEQLAAFDHVASGSIRVPYTRQFAAYAVVPAAGILAGTVPKELVSARYVLVGSSSMSLGDHVSTPLLALSPGVMVHAASLSGQLDLLEGRMQVPWSATAWVGWWVVLTVPVVMLGFAFLSAWRASAVVLVLAAVWFGVAWSLLGRQAEFSVTTPLWVMLFLVLVGMPQEWWHAQYRSSQLLRSLEHYVAKPVLDEIVRLNLQHSLQPKLLDVTVLVADMQGYTAATSALSLDDAAELTKEFLASLTRPVLDWQGTLDKYTGDGLVAFWGAPLVCMDQADRAVSAALSILQEVQALNRQRARRGFEAVQVRIGIEAGVALVGDLGTSFRSTYTAVGDCINFASRLETAVRDLPTQLLIGPVANQLLKQHQTQSLGLIRLRGTQTTIEVFAVTGTLDD